MQYAIRHIARWRIIAIGGAVTMMLLLAGAARAGAEGTEPVAAITAVAAENAENIPSEAEATPPSSEASEAIPPSSSEPATAVAEAPEPAQAMEPEVTTNVPPEAVAGEAPAPLPSADPASTEATDPPPATPAATTDSALRKSAAVPSADPGLNRDLKETTAAVIQSAGTSAEAVGRGGFTDHLQPLPRLTPPGDVGSALNGVPKLGPALDGVAKAAEAVMGKALDSIAGGSPGSVLQPAGGVPGVEFSAPPPQGISPSAPLGDSQSDEREIGRGSPLIQRRIELGDFKMPPLPLAMRETSSSAGAGSLTPSPRARRLVPVSAATTDFAGGGSANHAPLNGNSPTPLPSSPQGEVSGAGGFSFVPIAGLLALLALAAPTIFRRLGELAGFPAPTPFVCALERPG